MGDKHNPVPQSGEVNQIATLIIGPRYRLLDPLGVGGMGTVYRAFDRLSGHTVALKRVHVAPEQLQFASRANAAGDALLLALAQEFKILASLRHPHIISVLDYGFDAQRQPYFTMELLEQPQTLLEAARNQPLDFKINLLIQTLQALAYLHRRGILHHDLKPENVLVSNGQVRVLDFGLSVMRDQTREDDSSGTLLYLPPEIYKGGVYSQAGDLYALGVMAYEMLLGQHPFYTGDAAFFIDRLLEAEPDFSSLAAHPNLVAVIAKLLAKQPEQRYQDSHTVVADLSLSIGQPAPAESHAIRESFLQAATFVGREAELAQLSEALEKAMSGHGSAWLIGGESGVGKSRLLDELRTRALVAGATVLRGQAVEGGGLPYQLWREPLRRLVLSTELSDLEAGVLKPIVSDIGSLLERDIPDAPELPGEAGQQRLTLTIMDIFKRQKQLLTLLLEDLQWSGESLELLKRLNTLASELPLLVVANYRSDERPHLPDELPGMMSLPLTRLSADEVAELSAGMLGEGGRDPAIVERLQHETEGNTFFMVEVVRALAEAAGRLGDIGGMTLPRSILAGGIQKIVQRRLERVPGWGQALLRLAAVAGRQLDLDVLRALLTVGSGEFAVERLDEWLRTCADVAVLDIQDEQWRFAHDKLREGLLAALPPDERIASHRRVAQALETVHGEDGEFAEALADHWHEAGDHTRAMPYLIQSVERMVSLATGHQRAAQWIERGLNHATSRQRIQLLALHGKNAELPGDFDRAQQYYQMVLASPDSDLQLQVYSLNGLSQIAWNRSQNAECVAYALRALEIARNIDDQRGMAQSLYNLGIVACRTSDFRKGKTYIDDALARFRSAGDRVGEARSMKSLGLIAIDLGQFGEAETRLLEALDISRVIADRVGIAACLIGLGIVREDMAGDYRTALEAYEESNAICRQIGEPVGIAYGLLNATYSLLELGEIEKAEAYLEECAAIFEQVDEPVGKAAALHYQGRIAHSRKDYATARPLLEKAIQISHEIDSLFYEVGYHSNLVSTLLRLNELDSAHAHLIEAVMIALSLDIDSPLLRVLHASAEVAYVDGWVEDAALWLGRVSNQEHLGLWAIEDIKELSTKIQNTLGTDRYAVLAEQGKLLDLRKALSQLLDRLKQA